MSGRVFIFRPEPGWSTSDVAARQEGLEVAGHPLSRIEPVEWVAVDPRGFDGILAGSANAFRHGGEALEQLTGLPVHAVGHSTAAMARKAGFTVARVGSGGLQALLDGIPARTTRLLRLCGDRRVPLTPPAKVSIAERVVYRAVDLEIAESTTALLAQGGVAMLHSGEAARHFAAECTRLAIDRSKLALAVIGPRLLRSVGSGWRAVHIAATPDDGALLASARILCQDALWPAGRAQGDRNGA